MRDILSSPLSFSFAGWMVWWVGRWSGRENSRMLETVIISIIVVVAGRGGGGAAAAGQAIGLPRAFGM